MSDETRAVFEQLGVSLLLGLLVGLQREHAAAPAAGLRTFPLVAVLGTLAALLDVNIGGQGWLVAAGFVALAVIVGVSSLMHMRSNPDDVGITTEIALLVIYVLGAYVVSGDRAVAIAVGAGMAVLLQFKPELHGIVARLGDDDLRAIMQFALITFVVLPVLPREEDLPWEGYWPWEVLVPFEIWLMVVLIVGISLGGYIIYKFFGENVGIVIGGILGGAISSTATTASYARRAAQEPGAVRVATLVILIASTVVYARVLIEISVVAPELLRYAAAPIAAVAGAGALAAAVIWLRTRRDSESMPKQTNPTELKSAIIFAATYAAVRLALEVAREYGDQTGDVGLYGIAVLSGLTDMDAITLSSARMYSAGGEISAGTAWRLIVAASMANLVFKAGIALTLGNAQLALRLLGAFAVPMAAGAAAIAFWPG
ncbi:MAG: MgtC/SapB family protein [Pirellulales bacterium]